MTDESIKPGWPGIIDRIRARTPARVLVDRAGAGYRSATQLELRAAHAAARDAVRAELNMEHDLGAEFIRRWQLFETKSKAGSKDEYLLRPDLGRRFNEASALKITSNCPKAVDLQIVIGDGLSMRHRHAGDSQSDSRLFGSAPAPAVGGDRQPEKWHCADHRPYRLWKILDHGGDSRPR